MDNKASNNPSSNTFELNTTLAQIGLQQYTKRLTEHGFDDWETVKLVTESDMTELGFKLGDRRKLQRVISEESRLDAAYTEDRATYFPLPSTRLPTVGAYFEESQSSSQQEARTTRRYRRHPRPDPHAPSKPKTAYVVFGEHVRQDPAISNLSFAELAKETGKRWREHSHEERVNIWEKPAADRLQGYKEELDRYMQTTNYQRYQRYLEVFKQRQHDLELVISSDNESSSTCKLAPFGWLPATTGQKECAVSHPGIVDTEDLGSENQSQDTPSPVECGMKEVRRISEAFGIKPHLISASAFPPETVTAAAMKAFLDGTGSLLYLWDHDQASDLLRAVYLPVSDSIQLDMTEVFAMSAVGSYCDGETSSLSPQHNFLHYFLNMLSSISHICDLSRMRLFACLAICRFTDNMESARRLILCALDIGRQEITSLSLAAESSEEKLGYWQNIFRSIVFLESWFAYNTSHESRVTKQDLIFFRPPPSNVTDHLEPIHEKVGELGQLAAYIALDLKTSNQPQAMLAQGHFEFLDEWHRHLPPPIQLSHLSLANPLTINWHTKQSLLQLHTLFLGLFIEPYRSCLIDIGQSRLCDTPIEQDLLLAMKDVEAQCVLAARQSARVASLLQIDNLIASRCWVTVPISFTGCTVLLFSASQKLLFLAIEETSQDLLYTSSHLNVLSFCSYNSSTAKTLYTTLQIIFNGIREVVGSPAYHAMRELHLVVKDVAVVPSGYYDAVEGASEISKTILDLAGRTMAVLQDSINRTMTS